VLGDVPKSDRCRCHETTSVARPAAKSGAAKGAAEPADQSTFGRFKAWLHQ